ncbi:MAG: DNA primase [Candidatus Nanogingivalaceae bacterium]|jgi:DNA primase|nr:MAG: DNA primase [Candidatus Nanogingivalaceae bacterium]QWB91653.1 MAG: DNA primase [Candidatus Nanogingivalaceae bacterium]
MNDAREEIKSRISIEDLAGEYLELKRTGRNFKALSPWTNERTPSFIVSPDKQIWHDFSSGKGGDIFGFIMEVEGMNFREALEFLARKAGVEIETFNSKRSKEIAEKKERLRKILQISSNFYQHMLIRDKKALNYVFKKRKLSKEIVQDFKVGYAPNGQKILTNFLLKKGFSLNDIRDAGLLNRFGGDIFRNRMVITLKDASGEPVGFTGRIIDDEPNAPKYLNTPQTLLYDKSSNIFGLSQAKNEIRKTGFAVVVEGNMDVISSHQVDVRNVVATAGTAMTVNHLKALSRFSNDIRLCFDSDQAGINATERAISLGQQAGVELSIITLDQSAGQAKDPDELIQKDIELWRRSIANPQPAMEWIFDQYQKRLDISTAKGKKDFSTIALKLVENLNDPVEKDFYINEISKRIGVSKATLLNKIGEEKKPEKTKKRVKIEKTDKKFVDDFLYEDDLLALAIKEPRLAKMLSDLKENSLHGEQRNKILEILKSEDMELLKSFDEYVKILLLKADERLGNIKESATDEMKRLIQKVKTENLRTQKENLQAELENAEIQGDENLKTKILSKIIELNKELNSGKR